VRYIKVILISSILMYCVVPAIAVEGVTVIEATGVLDRTVFGLSSPTPGWCTWEHGLESGPIYSATELDGTGNTCGSWSWSIRCDTEGLEFMGSWPQFVQGAYSAQYSVAITYRVNLSAPKRLLAHRDIVGSLDSSIHSVSVTFPDSSVVELLLADGGANDEEIELAPATYNIVLIIEAKQTVDVGELLAPYSGLVILEWSDLALSSDSRRWGDIKALYR